MLESWEWYQSLQRMPWWGWDLLSEARMEMATRGAEMEAVDQSQVMPELGVRRGPEGRPLEEAELSNREMD